MNRTVLSLRPLETDDWQAVHSWGSRAEVCRYQVWGPNTVEQSKEFTRVAVAAWNADPQQRLVYAAVLDGRTVGSGELRIRDRSHGQGEIQYIVHPDEWGKGLGTAIGTELLNLGFTGHKLHRVNATCDPRNLASAAVLRKLGMSKEGRLRHTVRLRDGWRDSEIFGILSAEWTP